MMKLESLDITIIAMLPVCALLLWLLADYAEKVKSTRWRLFWLLP